jgi:hypothetical protein
MGPQQARDSEKHILPTSPPPRLMGSSQLDQRRSRSPGIAWTARQPASKKEQIPRLCTTRLRSDSLRYEMKKNLQ